MIKLTRLAVPGKGKTYPPWQGMQYMHGMYAGKCKLPDLDNSRYPIRFTAAKELLSGFLAGQVETYVRHC
ncbi:MAG: hypothetical protein JW793_06245 [Acidobacteria bacterium]|nr:hypothetical protein [Acidobacteriota bacterium]